MASRLDEARNVASNLLDELEAGEIPIESLLMKAKRMARLMRDTDAQQWLNYEACGYPTEFHIPSLGTCEKYAISSGRVIGEKFYPQSLPEIEATLMTQKISATSSSLTNKTPPVVKDFVEKNATEAYLKTQIKIHTTLTNNYIQTAKIFTSLKTSIHSYATDVHISIELGDIAERIFENARTDVDKFVRAYCPHAAEKIVAINERMSDHSPESWSAALTSCRRLLMAVADSLFPARAEEWIDGRGKNRKVGVEQYKNRLLAHISTSLESNGSKNLIESELEHLASRLDAVYEKTCKGVHVDVSREEASLAVIHTYMFLGELANISNANAG